MKLVSWISSLPPPSLLVTRPCPEDCRSLPCRIRSGAGLIRMQGKGNAACGLLPKWNSIFQKWVSLTPNGPIGMPQGCTTFVVIHL